MSLEQAFKATCEDASIAHGHGGVSVAQVILHCAQVGALVRKGVTTRMAQHVRMHVPEPSLLPSGRDQIIDGVPGERRAALADEQPGQLIVPTGEVFADGAQLDAAIGCSTDSEPLSRSTHRRARFRLTA
jgi:hypothetical protein